jgi:hypothetical protein
MGLFKVGHIRSIIIDVTKVVVAKLIVYPGDPEEYFTFITSKTYFELEKWMDYRKEVEEEINERSWVMYWKWDSKQGYKRGLVIANMINVFSQKRKV